MNRRRRRVLSYLSFFRAYIAVTAPARSFFPEVSCLPPEFIQPGVVYHHEIRPPRFFFPRELALLDRFALLLIDAAILRPFPTTFLRRRYRDSNVERPAASSLEEQRYLDHEDLRLRGRRAPVGLLSNQGMKYALQMLQSIRISENFPSESFAIYARFAADLFSEALDDTGYGFRVAGEQVMDDLVPRDRLCAKVAEHPNKGALTASKRTGNSYRHRPSV